MVRVDTGADRVSASPAATGAEGGATGAALPPASSKAAVTGGNMLAHPSAPTQGKTAAPTRAAAVPGVAAATTGTGVAVALVDGKATTPLGEADGTPSVAPVRGGMGAAGADTVR